MKQLGPKQPIPAPYYLIPLVGMCLPFLVLVWLPFYLNGMYHYDLADFNTIQGLHARYYPPFAWVSDPDTFVGWALGAWLFTYLTASMCSVTILWKVCRQWAILTRTAKFACIGAILVVAVVLLGDCIRLLYWVVPD